MANTKVTKTLEIKAETTDAKGKVKFLTQAVIKLNDETKKTSKAFEELSRNIAKATKDFQENLKGLDNIRKGFKFESPFKKLSTSVNKRFNRQIKDYAKQYEETIPELTKLQGKKKLTKKETARKEKLEQDQAKYMGSIKKAAIAQGAFNTAANAAKALSKPFKQLEKAILDNVTAMLSFRTGVATYSSSSVVANTAARQLKMRFGMSDAQAYGFQQARTMLNIQSDEDLYYMNAQQREKLLEYMDRYSNWYNKMEQSGMLETIQEFQLEFNEFKMEIAQDLLKWLADNKDVIIPALKVVIDVIKWIAVAIANILNVLSFGKYKNSTYSSDAFNSGSTTNQRYNNVTINANVTNNGDSSSIQTQQDNMWSNLAKQIVTATK